MLPLLFDEGLPAQVAVALSALSLEATAVGQGGAPSRGSGDDVNCSWCRENSAVLVTNDRGKANKEIHDFLAQHHVHAVFVSNDLRNGPEHLLARAVLIAEREMEQIVARGLVKHHLRPSGKLSKR